MTPALCLMIVVGAIFGILGALTAYLITYREWIHHYPDKRRPKKMALEAAALAFVLLIAIAILVGMFA